MPQRYENSVCKILLMLILLVSVFHLKEHHFPDVPIIYQDKISLMVKTGNAAG